VEGQTVSHYKVFEKIGEGGMGEVYRAKDTRLNRLVALKFLSRELSAESNAYARFKREARAASALNHPHICVIYDIGEVEAQPFIAMEYLEGQNLRKRIERGRLDTLELLDLGIQISSGLEAAHSKDIVHRDIKPENIFVTDQSLAKILDFGLAKLIESRRQADSPATTTAGTEEFGTGPGRAPGTIGYMSPEQLCGDPIDLRSDIFSLGIVLAESAAGKRPYRAGTVQELLSKMLCGDMEALPSDLPPGFHAVVQKCLERQPDRRYRQAGEVRVALETLKEASQAQRRARPYETAETDLPSEEIRIRIRRVNDVAILDIRGKVLLERRDSEDNLGVVLSRLLDEGTRRILLNLQNVNYMDSTVLANLFSCSSDAINRGGELKFVNLTKKLQGLLAVTKLLTFIECYDDEETALKSFH